MSNIVETKEGLVEKSTGRKIVSPLDNKVLSAKYNENVFYADSGHFYLSKGISAINEICVIQKSLLNELSHEE